jgi:hypothetical protein
MRCCLPCSPPVANAGWAPTYGGSVPDLLLTGQDVAGPGVQAAFMAGLMAAAAVDSGVWRELGR